MLDFGGGVRVVSMLVQGKTLDTGAGVSDQPWGPGSHGNCTCTLRQGLQPESCVVCYG